MAFGVLFDGISRLGMGRGDNFGDHHVAAVNRRPQLTRKVYIKAVVLRSRIAEPIPRRSAYRVA